MPNLENPNGKLVKWQVDKMAILQNGNLAENAMLAKWLNVKSIMPNCQNPNVKLARWQVGKMSSCQNDKLTRWQVDKWQADKMA
jgi:hypothetical protein